MITFRWCRPPFVSSGTNGVQRPDALQNGPDYHRCATAWPPGPSATPHLRLPRPEPQPSVAQIQYLREDEVEFDEAENDDLEDFGADFGDDEDDSGEEGTSGVAQDRSCSCSGDRVHVHVLCVAAH